MTGLPAEVERFAKYFAGLEDPAARERVLTQVKMQAMAEASEEVFDHDQIRTLGEYLDSEIEVPPELVSPYQVVRGGLNAIIGRSGKGKTVMSLNRLLRWSCGKPLFDKLKDKDGNTPLTPEKPLKTLIIENEGAAGMFHRQIGIMLSAEEFMSDDDRKLAKENVLIWGDGGYSNLKVDDAAKWNPVRRGIEKHRPDIVFVEPFRSLWSGEENSATEMAKVVDGLVQVAAEYECAVLIAHHEKKGGAGEDDKMSAARGSTVLENFVTVMENFGGVSGVDQRELSWSKSRHAKAPNSIRMAWDEHNWWYRWVPSSELEEAIIDAFRQHSDGGAMTIASLQEVTGQTKENLRKLCMALVNNGRLKKLPGTSDGNGSSGFRYMLANEDEDNANGGLSV